MNRYLSIAILFVASMCAQDEHRMIIRTQDIHKPFGCRDELSVDRGPYSWYVNNHNSKTKHFVQKADVDPAIRNIPPEELKDILQSGVGYLTLNRCDDGSYTIRQKTRARGGGPIFGALGYGVTLAAGYAVPVVGGLTLISATARSHQNGGQPLDNSVIQSDQVKSDVNSCITWTSKAAQCPKGTAQAGKAMTSTGAHEGAANATVVGAITGASTSYIAAVHGAAQSVGAYLTAIPWLP